MAIKKSENKTNKKIEAIKKENLLFGALYIQEELDQLSERKIILKQISTINLPKVNLFNYCDQLRSFAYPTFLQSN